MNLKQLILIGCAAIPFLVFSLPTSLSVNIRSYDHSGYTRIVFEGNKGFEYEYSPSKNTLDLQLYQKVSVKYPVESFPGSELVDRVEHRLKKKSGKTVNRSVFRVYFKSDVTLKRNFVLEKPFRVVFDVEKSSPAVKPTPALSQQDPKPEPPKIDPQPLPAEKAEKKHTLINMICIDPGHGGTDWGAVGRSKIMEKDITLKVSNKLKKLIESKLGLEVVMTRDKDEEVSLNSRVSKANNQKAQIFVSVHVNSSFRRSARGSETYYVSLKATDQESQQLSQKENEAFGAEIEQLATDSTDELKMILWNMAQTEYIQESSVLADYIQDELNVLLSTENRGVKQAPFRVLMRAAMPAVLVEVAFISNSSEEKKLNDDVFLDQVAYALYSGISKFVYYHNNLYKEK